MKIKCVVVDDEPLALELVCNFVNKTGFLELKAKFDSALDALSFINANSVDLIFLDIQMSDLTGMELARVLEGRKGNHSPKIIFTTAYNQFAIEGYKVDALDLKYFEQRVENRNSIAEDYLFLKVEYQLVKVMLKDIILVEGYKDYVKVHLDGKESPLLSLTTLKNMEELLPENQFMRVHRSYIISLEQIKSISKSTVNMGIMSIGISDGYKEKFLQFISKWIN